MSTHVRRMSTHLGRRVAIVFATALLLRVLVVCWLRFAPPSLQPGMSIFAADALTYDALARDLLAGRGYQWHGDFAEISRIPPLFPIFLAAIYAVTGPSVFVVGLANALLGALTAVALFFLIKLCFSDADSSQSEAANTSVDAGQSEDARAAERIAFVAALMFAAYPLEIFNTPYVLKENLSIFLTVGFALAWANLLRAASPKAASPKAAWKWAIWCGLALGLSVLSRFAHLGLAVLFMTVILWRVWRARRRSDASRFSASHSRRLISGGALAIGVFVVTISPWLARNYNIFGQVVLSPHGPGRYLANANSDLAQPETSGYYEAHGKMRERNRPIDQATRNDVLRRERMYLRSALSGIAAHPAHVVRLVGGKIVSMWRPVWKGSSSRAMLILGVPYIVLMALALPGLVLAGARKPPRATSAMAVLYALLFYYVVGHAVFYGMIRERQYVEPYLMAFAAYALDCAWRARKKDVGARTLQTP